MKSRRRKFGVMPVSECSQSLHKATTLQTWGKVDMQEGLASQRNWPRVLAEGNVLFFLQKRRSKGLHKATGAAKDQVSPFQGCGYQNRHCSVFSFPLSSPLQSSTFKQRLSPPLFPLSNYTIYSFSAVISSHLYSPERSQDNHHGE